MIDVSVKANQNYRSYRAQCEHYLARPHKGIPTGPVNSPSAWRVADIVNSASWRYEFTAEEIEEIEAAIRHGKATGRPMANWTAGDFPLPKLSARIARWREEIKNGCGFVLLSGLPVDRWGVNDSEHFFWAFGLHLGIPGAQNPQGDLLGHVTDTKRNLSDPMVRLYQTPSTLSYHCDAADVVGLLCLQSAVSGGASRIASSVTVWNELWRRDRKLAERLFKPFYIDLRNEQDPGGNPWNVITPCTYANNMLHTFYHVDYFLSVERHGIVVSEEDKKLLALYEEIANSEEVYFDMMLKPGDIQLISNHTILHARTSYEDSPERRRHLLRLWLSL